MKERPILFNGEMVRAVMDGRKTQTRRVIKPQPKDPKGPNNDGLWSDTEDPVTRLFACPYGQPGDRLYVRETWRCRGGREYEYQQHQPSIMYRADAAPESYVCDDWRPSIHMPRWASRITLEVESVRVERVQEITRGDAMEEGCPFSNMQAGPNPKHWFRDLWDSINGPRGFGWDVNPWVWVITFRRVK